MSTTAAAPEIPKTHKACVYDKPGSCSIAIKDVPTPEPGPGEVLVKLTHSGICHSDYGIMMNSWKTLPFPTEPGQIGGHEGLGHIVKLGEGAESAGVKIGDRVGIKWVAAACLACLPCTEGSEGLCFNQKVSGYYTPGTFQEYVVGPANYVTPVPDSLPGELAAPMLCAGVTTYSALRKSGASPGQWVAISGAGGGLGTIATSLAANAMGLRVIGLDLPSKREAILASGAEHFVDVTAFDDDAIAEEVKRLTGGHGAASVIVCTANNRAYGQALGMLRFNGSLVCVGMPEGEPVPIAGSFPAALVQRQLRIVSSAVGNRREAVETLDMAVRGVVRFPVRSVPMSGLGAVFDDMGAGRVVGRVVVDMSLP
ncbi:putative alcohol dehydrogenase II [Rosellinia necatrix]|uniref:Putative alcohol dehydrogenase II n=1 Tax=Rosellinia necatrix TaxID=77044 RepID=A0A1S7UM01_ROSNE|nr:putative alcohol dehydrogenase II [Rosellinia necatrix]